MKPRVLLLIFFLVTSFLTPRSAFAEREPAVYNQTTFTKLGWPGPWNPTPLSGTLYSDWKTYLMQQAVKADTYTGVDAGIIGMWAWIETNFSTYADNCNGYDSSPNTPCYSWGDYWQVGYGIHVGTQIDSLKEALSKMRPDKTTQQVGQAVIDGSSVRSGTKITYPESTFPSTSIDTIVSQAKSGDIKMRARAATLMKDDGVGAYLVAKSFLQEGYNSNLAWTMSAWPPYGYYDRQKLINRIKAIYDAKLLLPVSETLTPYTSDEMKSESSNGWKNTLIEVRKPIEVKQLAFFNAGGGHSFEIRKSSLSGEVTGRLITSGQIEATGLESNYFYTSLPFFPLSPGYYVIRIYVPSGDTSYAGTIAKQFEDISFLKKSSGDVAASTTGSYKIRFVYINTY